MYHGPSDEPANHVPPAHVGDPAEPTAHHDPIADAFDGLDLQRRMVDHPYPTLLVAAGVGYVLGGGLFTQFTAGTVSVAARVALLPLLQRGIVEALENVAGGQRR